LRAVCLARILHREKIEWMSVLEKVLQDLAAVGAKSVGSNTRNAAVPGSPKVPAPLVVSGEQPILSPTLERKASLDENPPTPTLARNTVTETTTTKEEEEEGITSTTAAPVPDAASAADELSPQSSPLPSPAQARPPVVKERAIPMSLAVEEKEDDNSSSGASDVVANNGKAAGLRTSNTGSNSSNSGVDTAASEGNSYGANDTPPEKRKEPAVATEGKPPEERKSVVAAATKGLGLRRHSFSVNNIFRKIASPKTQAKQSSHPTQADQQAMPSKENEEKSEELRSRKRVSSAKKKSSSSTTGEGEKKEGAAEEDHNGVSMRSRSMSENKGKWDEGMMQELRRKREERTSTGTWFKKNLSSTNSVPLLSSTDGIGASRLKCAFLPYLLN
jgi:hypothetical protein